jgi:hypothetical protein
VGVAQIHHCTPVSEIALLRNHKCNFLDTYCGFSFCTVWLVAALYSAHRQARLNLEHGQRPNDMLPVSHTCFFTIDLPEYTTLEAITAKVTYAMV